MSKENRRESYPTKGMLTISEAASLLGVHTNTIRNWHNKGILKASRFGPRRDRRFKIEEIEKYINHNS